MRTFVAFVMILALGLFCAVGCGKPAPMPPQKPPVSPPPEKKADQPAPEKTATPPAKPEEKPGDKNK
jgi:hypothetical protein